MDTGGLDYEKFTVNNVSQVVITFNISRRICYRHDINQSPRCQGSTLWYQIWAAPS